MFTLSIFVDIQNDFPPTFSPSFSTTRETWLAKWITDNPRGRWKKSKNKMETMRVAPGMKSKSILTGKSCSEGSVSNCRPFYQVSVVTIINDAPLQSCVFLYNESYTSSFRSRTSSRDRGHRPTLEDDDSKQNWHGQSSFFVLPEFTSLELRICLKNVLFLSHHFSVNPGCSVLRDRLQQVRICILRGDFQTSDAMMYLKILTYTFSVHHFLKMIDEWVKKNTNLGVRGQVRRFD